MEPIFIHSGFRTSSTWLWTKFRAHQNVLAYCEVFHECFSDLSVEDAQVAGPNSWRSGHPPSDPYFLEYIPLIAEGGGVPAFQKSMPYERLIPRGGAGGALTHEEITYLQTLIDHAASQQRRPVLTCTRLLGRAAGCKAAFGGTHILLLRDPFKQWASYSGQAAGGNPFFFDTLILTFRHALHDPAMALIDRLTPRRTYKPDDLETFVAFLLTQAYLEATAAGTADLILHATALAHDADLRARTMARIEALTGLPVDLSDARDNLDRCLLVAKDLKGLSERLDAALVGIFPSVDQAERLAFARQRLREAVATARAFFAAAPDA